MKNENLNTKDLLNVIENDIPFDPSEWDFLKSLSDEELDMMIEIELNKIGKSLYEDKS